MEVADGQQLGLPLGEPLARRRALTLWTMPVATTVVSDDRVTTAGVLTARDMAAERRGPAALDRRHDLELAEAHAPGAGRSASGAVGAEDGRNLQSGTGQEAGVTSPAARPCLAASAFCARSADRGGSRLQRSDLWRHARNAPSSPISHVREGLGSF